MQNGSSIKYWLQKLFESFISVTPIFLVVLILFLTGVISGFTTVIFRFLGFPPMGGFGVTSKDTLITPVIFIGFTICVAMIIFGLCLFSIGSEQSMSQIGQVVGNSLTKKGNLFLVIAMAFILGIIVTVAEPDLQTLSKEMVGVPSTILIIAVGIGVGIFLVIGTLRVLFHKSLNIMFLAFYALVFSLVAIINPKFLPFCFDAGGVSTGPVTVPFVLAFGAGLAASHSSGHQSDDSFGLTALCSIGPVITVMLLSLFISSGSLVYPTDVLVTSEDFGTLLASNLLTSIFDVSVSILPIIIFFLVYEAIFIKLPLKNILKILVGLIYMFIGLVVFLTAVGAGFLPVAQIVGGGVASNAPLAIAIGSLFGLFGVLAEPAVHVLVRQIEVVTDGAINHRTILAVLAVSIAGAVALSLIRIYYQIPIIYFLLPGYAIALALSFVVPPLYTAIAFDSGGVASGPMTTTFVLPFCIGISNKLGADAYTYAFGVVAFVSMMPLIVVELLGLYAETKRRFVYRQARAHIIAPDDDQIIHFVGAA